MELLRTLKASSPVFPNDDSKVLSVNKDDTISKAFQVLIDNNILSVPVYDKNEKKFCCFFSMLDIIQEILDVTNNFKLPDGDISSVLTILQEKQLFKMSKVGDIANISKRDPFIIVNSEMKLDDVARVMVRNNIRRVPVLDSRGELCNVITNSRLIECVSHLFGMDHELTKMGQQTIAQLNIINYDVISVRSDKGAQEAFKIIAEMGVSGVGIVDQDNKLIGSINDSDLKLIKSHAQYLSLLYLPISQYLQVLEELKMKSKQILTFKETDCFKDVLENIVATKSHRLFLVDDDFKLKGVVSLQDILEKIVISV
ncbi:hypothetical protein CYY_007161 [Polysphondylium violaceum]|uniref:CBS domain-containing protein n=1 Tax=Polysphondylium violaceum TaxID=133409 RepID=A0A8J4PP18_9MYCE|nr:hypothetical protein CYY_007161 [Polysphondylium violaceum]